MSGLPPRIIYTGCIHFQRDLCLLVSRNLWIWEKLYIWRNWPQFPQIHELLQMTFAGVCAFTLHTIYYLKHSGNNCWDDPEYTLIKYTLLNQQSHLRDLPPGYQTHQYWRYQLLNLSSQWWKLEKCAHYAKFRKFLEKLWCESPKYW